MSKSQSLTHAQNPKNILRISLLGTHPKDTVQMKENDKSIKMFTAVLFIIIMMMKYTDIWKYTFTEMIRSYGTATW